jgi:dihydrofolate synthase/folylpolyglutamate synthase
MADRIDSVLARLHGLYPRLIDLSLGRLSALLAKLGHPERRLPPIIHVAGTNGKGSTCAFLRAIGEAAGMRVHVFTSPHLIRFTERIVLAGVEVSEEALVDALERCVAANAGAPVTVFEVITAAAFLLFAETPADLLVLEVGLGGRGDSTNVIERPAVCAITSISIDHREMLGDTLAKIAAEKAGIIKQGATAVTGLQDAEALAVLRAAAASQGVALLARDAAWTIAPEANGLRFSDRAGALSLPLPGLAGQHQFDNAGIAVAAMRESGLRAPDAAYAQGLASARWPGRMQRLTGLLAAMLPEGFELWLDGGHNPGGAEAIAAHLKAWRDLPVYLIVGMKQAKDTAIFLSTIMPLAVSVWAVREDRQYQAMPVSEVVAVSQGRALAGPTVAGSLAAIARDYPPGRVLICGSLYLAGAVLAADSGLESR